MLRSGVRVCIHESGGRPDEAFTIMKGKHAQGKYCSAFSGRIRIRLVESHGTYIRWALRIRRARKVQTLLFDMFKAFDQIETSRKSDFFSEKTFIHVLSSI